VSGPPKNLVVGSYVVRTPTKFTEINVISPKSTSGAAFNVLNRQLTAHFNLSSTVYSITSNLLHDPLTEQGIRG